MKESVTTLEIPVSNHVYLYLLKKCGSDHLHLTYRNFYGSLILSALSLWDYVKNQPFEVQPKEHTITLHVSNTFLERYAPNIDIEKPCFLNILIDKQFKEEIFTYAWMNRLLEREKFIVSIRKYLEAYGIYEEDYSLDTMYRNFNRRKEDFNKKNHDHQPMQFAS